MPRHASASPKAGTSIHRPAIDYGHRSVTDGTPTPGYQTLTPNQQLYTGLIFGGLLVSGFFFGIVAGYHRPQVIVVKATSDSESPKGSPSALRDKEKNEKFSEHASPKVSGSDGSTPPRTDSPPTPPSQKLPPTPSSGTPITPSPRPIDSDTGNKLGNNPVAMTPPVRKELPKEKEPPKGTVPPRGPMPPAGLTPVSFQKDVLPIFRAYCLNCHGAGSGKPKGGVDLRTVAAIMKGGGAPILVVGQPEKSAIYTTIEDMSMPPEGKRPTPQELAIIRNWILTGAKERRRRSPLPKDRR